MAAFDEGKVLAQETTPTSVDNQNFDWVRFEEADVDVLLLRGTGDKVIIHMRKTSKRKTGAL